MIFILLVKVMEVYSPYLMTRILELNQNNPADNKIQLRGFLVGNPMTSFEYDLEAALPEFTWFHELYSQELRDDWLSKECG